MTRRLLIGFLGVYAALTFCAFAAPAQGRAGTSARPAPAVDRLTIDQLLDIKHPSNPVWSRDSRSIAFSWERAGVANVYVVPADGSAKAIPVTSDGEPVTGITWSADSRTIYLMRGGTLVQVAADGSQAPRPVWPPSPSFSRT